jgi:hypothetical protein
MTYPDGRYPQPDRPTVSWEQAPGPRGNTRPEIGRIAPLVRSALLRGRFADRLISVNAAHAGHAADLIRTRDDLCEHALVLYSASPFQEAGHEVSIATRLSLSDNENADILGWLNGLCRVVEQRLHEAGRHDQRWDPRTPLTGLVSRSEDLSPQMIYMGVGVSTLDTPEQPWRQMKSGVERYSGLRLRGQGYLLIDDDTTIHLVRAPQVGAQAGQHRIIANQAIETQYRNWIRQPDMMAAADQRTSQIWELMRRLHFVLKTVATR